MLRRAGRSFLLVLLASAPSLALAQAPMLPPMAATPRIAPILPAQQPAAAPATPAGTTQDAPVTFTADEVHYDQNAALVVARGSVEAFQGGRVLRADELTYNRNSGVATARGNVQLI